MAGQRELLYMFGRPEGSYIYMFGRPEGTYIYVWPTRGNIYSCLAGQREHIYMFGRPEGTYIYMIVLFYYIDTAKDFKWRIFRDKQ